VAVFDGIGIGIGVGVGEPIGTRYVSMQDQTL
jgi:hypothetical protein